MSTVTLPEPPRLAAHLSARVQSIAPNVRPLLYPPCPADSLARLQQELKASTGFQLPEGHIAFLAASNGLEFDGKVFYAAEAPSLPRVAGSLYQLPRILEVNNHFKGCLSKRSWLLVGRTDLDLLVFDAASSKYLVVDETSQEAHQTFGSLPELFTSVFEYLEDLAV